MRAMHRSSHSSRRSAWCQRRGYLPAEPARRCGVHRGMLYPSITVSPCVFSRLQRWPRRRCRSDPAHSGSGSSQAGGSKRYGEFVVMPGAGPEHRGVNLPDQLPAAPGDQVRHAPAAGGALRRHRRTAPRRAMRPLLGNGGFRTERSDRSTTHLFATVYRTCPADVYSLMHNFRWD